MDQQKLVIHFLSIYLRFSIKFSSRTVRNVQRF